MTPKSSRSDPTLMLAIFALAVGWAIWRVVSKIEVGALAMHASRLVPLALLATLITSALVMQRLLRTRRGLSARRSMAVVPADEFRADPELVLRLAAQLSQTERSVAGWLDRRASALRIKLTCDAQGRLVYLLSFPERAHDLIRDALRGVEGLELRDAAEVLGVEDPTAKASALVRTELVLALPSIEPLARLGLEPDPLQPFATAVASLRREGGEQAAVCIDLLPAWGRRRARLRRVLSRQADRRHGDRPGLAELVSGEGSRRRNRQPTELVERRDVNAALDAKLRDSGPLYEAQILIRCEAELRGRAKETTRALVAAFAPLGARNWLRASGLAIPGIAFLGSDLPGRRRRFDRRFETGLFKPARRSILTGRELAGFLKPPTADLRADNVLRSGAVLSRPPALPEFDTEDPGLIPLGRIRAEGGAQIVGVNTAESFFSYIAGRSRYGKTELAITQFVHLVRSGHGGLFLDPPGDALGRIRPYLTDPELARRVVEIDLGPGSAAAKQPGWNLFELRGASLVEVEARVEAIVDAFATALEWGERSTRAINLMTQAAQALAAIARVVPPQIAPTIFQIPTLLTDEEFREAVLPYLPKASRQFWQSRFGRLAEEAITPITNLVDRLSASTATLVLFGQSQSSYRVRTAMDAGQIVLAATGSGGPRSRLAANLLLFDALHAGKSRVDLPPDKRPPFYLACDEVQSYDNASSDNLAGLLEQGAKFGLRAILLNQNPERLSAATLNAVTTNRSHMIVSALNHHAAGLLTKEMGGQVSAAAITQLPRYHFVAQVTYRGALSKPFALGGIQVEEIFGEGSPEAIPELRRISAAATARSSAAQVAAHQETLDERILEALRAGGAGEDSGGEDDGGDSGSAAQVPRRPR